LLRSAAGEGVKTRLHDAQRQSWTISIFFLRVPLRVTWALPQCGQRSGRLSVCGTRVVRMRVPALVIGVLRWRKPSTGNGLRKLEAKATDFGRPVGHGYWTV
jgi:hypothetical protein